MNELLISSRRNPLVKRLRNLGTRKGRESEGLLLLEGTHLLQELFRVGGTPVELVATEHWCERNPYLLDQIGERVIFRMVTEEVLKIALTTVTPDGVASICSLKALPPLPDSVDFLLILDRLQDPGNVGNILRTALAADVRGVWLVSGVDPLASKVLRSSSGALLNLPHKRFGPSVEEAIDSVANRLNKLAMEGFQVVGTLVQKQTGSLKAIPYWQLDWTKPTVLLLGTEGSGLHPRLLKSCNHAITVPHSSRVESLNVASAAVPMLLERTRMTMSVKLHKNG